MPLQNAIANVRLQYDSIVRQLSFEQSANSKVKVSSEAYLNNKSVYAVIFSRIFLTP